MGSRDWQPDNGTLARLPAVLRAIGPRFTQCRGHDQMSILAHFDAGEETLGREILDFRQGL